MKIETTVKIIDDDGNIVESRKLVEAAIPAIDAFGDKKKFLYQFDVTEKAIIHANKGASEQALTAYFEEVSKKKPICAVGPGGRYNALSRPKPVPIDGSIKIH